MAVGWERLAESHVGLQRKPTSENIIKGKLGKEEKDDTSEELRLLGS